MSESDGVLERLDVSRETSDRLYNYVELLKKWTPKINLVSKSSLDQLWTRHIWDSAQLFELVPRASHWVDLGSGGGFPGLVIASLAAESNPEMKITLIESDQRKAQFLRTVVRETGINATVIVERVEQVEPQRADVLSARALSDLTGLLGFAERHLEQDGTALFPKGINWQKEVSDALTTWSFEQEQIKSKTESGAVILKIRGVKRV
ncbi:MAG: 16S rRNA (guanine(527)-N(7))-methyltransferase RsmG [Paracoccaceae bacterium]